MVVNQGPIPRDPRGVHTSPEEVSQRSAEILDEPADTLAEEADQLHRAHAVLNHALNAE